MAESYDIVIRLVPHYGWFYLLVKDGVEHARGEFRPDALASLLRGLAMAEKIFHTEFAAAGVGHGAHPVSPAKVTPAAGEHRGEVTK